MPWRADDPGYGFAVGFPDDGASAQPQGTPSAPWLPQPESFARYAADQQVGVEGSTFELYRQLIGIRGELDLGTGRFAWSPFHAPERGVLAFTVTTGGGAHLGSGEPIPEKTVLVLANLGETAVDMPQEYAAAVFSHDESVVEGQLMPDSAAWFLRD